MSSDNFWLPDDIVIFSSFVWIMQLYFRQVLKRVPLRMQLFIHCGDRMAFPVWFGQFQKLVFAFSPGITWSDDPEMLPLLQDCHIAVQVIRCLPVSLAIFLP